jgi:transcriptional regulator with XRE-family HTH domain
MDARALGAAIRKAREKKGLTQLQAAKLAGLPKRTYETYERGELESPAVDKLGAIAKALDLASIDLGDFTAEQSGEPPPPGWEERMDRLEAQMERLAEAVEGLKTERPTPMQGAGHPFIPSPFELLNFAARPDTETLAREVGSRPEMGRSVPKAGVGAPEGELTGTYYPALAIEVPGLGVLLFRVSLYVEGRTEPIRIAANIGGAPTPAAS